MIFPFIGSWNLFICGNIIQLPMNVIFSWTNFLSLTILGELNDDLVTSWLLQREYCLQYEVTKPPYLVLGVSTLIHLNFWVLGICLHLWKISSLDNFFVPWYLIYLSLLKLVGCDFCKDFFSNPKLIVILIANLTHFTRGIICLL